MRGWLIENGFLKSAAFDQMYGALENAAARQGISLERRANEMFCPLSDALFLNAPDFVLFFDKDVRLARQMEQRGLPVFNSARSIALCDDKTLTYLALKDAVPMPETILAPLTFTNYGQAAFLDRVGETLKYPYVMKQGCGSFGREVYLVESAAQARAILAPLGERPVLFQRFVRESFGRDARLYIVGGRCVAAMERENLSGDFRANIAGGGRAKKHVPTDEEIKVALTAARALGLTFAGVDLLFSENGPLLCEVNSNAHFTALRELTGIDPGDAIFEEIRRQCKA